MPLLPSGINSWTGLDNVNRAAFNEQWDTLDALLRDYRKEVDVSSKDAVMGIYKVINYKRPIATPTLYLKATLSVPDANGYYTKDTWQYYDTAGTTVVKTVVWTLTYDVDGIVLTAVPA